MPRVAKVQVDPDDLKDVPVEYGAAIALWCRVLEQAFDDLRESKRAMGRKNSRRRLEGNVRMVSAQALYLSTVGWFFTSEMTGIGSFVWLCEQLDMDVSAMRSAARRITGGHDEKD